MKRVVKASQSTSLYEGRRVEVDAHGDIILICYDPAADEEFEKHIGSHSSGSHNLQMLKKDGYFSVPEKLICKMENLLNGGV